jgi:NAD(P)-dependent dehydrogenase (short-subunit alcohol dehydrogenase family)
MSDGRVILVTGASTGIGAATARLAGDRGYAVCVNFRRNRDKADAVVDAIRAGGGTAIAVSADVADEADVVRMFATVDAELGRVTALVNNAGMVPGRRGADEVPGDEVAVTVATKVHGALLCGREALRRMLPRHGGRGGAIVNVSSASARHGAVGFWIHYAAANGALDTYTVGLSKEVARHGVRVNGVRPGFIDTAFHDSAVWGGRLAENGPKQPLGRAGRPEEIAALILWLLSDEASYVSGAIVDAHAGR